MEARQVDKTRAAPVPRRQPQPVLVGGAEEEHERGSSAQLPVEQRGATYIEDDVVSVIARTAAANVAGIHSIGDSSLRHWIAQLGRHHGVDSEVGLKEAAIDVEVVVEFGYSVREVANALRRHIIETVETMTGRNVVEVNVFVVDVNIPKLERRKRRQVE